MSAGAADATWRSGAWGHGAWGTWACAALAAIALAACGDGVRPTVVIGAPAELTAGLEEFVEFIPARGLEVTDGEARASRGLYRIDVALDLPDCAECYRVEPVPGDAAAWVVHAGDVLGVHYGVAEVFELLGYRFRHPFATYVPARPRPDPAAVARLGQLHRPAMTERGLHLHTLHPTEAEYAVWEPTDGGVKARRIFDWIVKNRGNFVQWVGLDDILDDERRAAWRADTGALLAAAHARGLRVGLGLQIFGASSLQLGFDLIDDEDAPAEPQIAARLPLIVDGVPFDTYELSFGEFFGADPDAFVQTVDLVYRQLHALAPAADVTAVIHVGDSPDQRVTYRGENLIYYFLVKFADPRIVPQFHTVMYYNLWDDAGGAYHHADFSEHREFLLKRLRDGQRVQYKPETAYWVAFDNSVPVYLPIYLLSRQLDRDRIAATAAAAGHPPLTEELLFSSGWEWGYWQNDALGLRAMYAPPTSVAEQLAELYAPDHPALALRIVELATAQYDGLIGQRLAAYQAGRDALIDLGAQAGVIAAPDRVDVDDIGRLEPAARAAFAAGTGAALTRYAETLAEIAARIERLPATDRWVAEIIDGAAVTRLRAQFIAAIYAAAVAAADGDDPAARAALATAEAAMTEARAVVARRHGDRHDPDPRLIDSSNRTLYQYGYLRFADDLCFWERERVMATNAVLGASGNPPGCFFP